MKNRVLAKRGLIPEPRPLRKAAWTLATDKVAWPCRVYMDGYTDVRILQRVSLSDDVLAFGSHIVDQHLDDLRTHHLREHLDDLLREHLDDLLRHLLLAVCDADEEEVEEEESKNTPRHS